MIYRVADYLSERMSYKLLPFMYKYTSPAFLDRLSRHRFIQTVRWAGTHSAFYREAFARLGIHPKSVRRPEDLGDFFTTPDDLVRDPEKFLCKAPSIVFESSGTSGKNKQVYYDQYEMEDMGTVAASGLRLMGVTPDDRIANAFDFSMWIPGMILQQGLQRTGNFCQVFSKVDPIEVYRRLKQYRFTVVLGEPTWLIRLTELAEKNGPVPLKLLIGGAEEMPADAIPWMQKVWGGATVKMCYGSVELGSGLGFQPCSCHDGYHLDNVNFLSEIVEPDAEGYGELIFSTLRRRVMPLIRYRTRDISRISYERCPCGLPAPRLAKLRGRRDEMVVASGGNLYPLMFEHILRNVPGLTHDWQVVFTLDGVREVMDIRVETDRGDIDVLEEEIHDQAKELYPDLIKNLALGIFRMKVTTYPTGALRRERKLRRMVDLRHFVAAADQNEQPAQAPSNVAVVSA